MIRLNKNIVPTALISLSLFLLSGCASMVKFIAGTKTLEIPQIVAYLEPVLRNNKITVSGKIVIQNPTESALDLEKIYLTVKDENNNILAQDVLTWNKPSVVSKEELESPVEIYLGLSALNKKSLGIFIRTAFIYKSFDLRIPIESKVAVLNLSALREIIARPLYVNIYTKLKSNVLGNSSLNYSLDITNPLSIDLILEEGLIRIHTLNDKDIARSKLDKTLFRASQSNQIKGFLEMGNIFGKLIRDELIRRHPLTFELSGKLIVPDTDIYMPFKIESIQEVDISFSGL